MTDKKRTSRVRQWAADLKKDPDRWAAASASAGQVNDAIISLMLQVGNQATADFLRHWAEVLAASERSAKRRKSSAIPSISGRRARKADADASDKVMLLIPGRAPNGRLLTVSDLARWKAHRDNISIDAARRHLTRLKRELMAEMAASPPSPPMLTEAEQPNWLLRLAGIRATEGET